MMGSYAIIGAHLTIANGAAWSAQMRGTDQVAVCFIGAGTTNIGAFHQALNLAAIWDLPVIFVCENNLRMEYTPIDLITAVPNPAADRATAYGLESIIVDGNDADAVYQMAKSVIERARRGEDPALVEAQTYREQGHSRADPGKYRPAAEIEARKARDPIPMYNERLLRLGVPERDLSSIQQPRTYRPVRELDLSRSEVIRLLFASRGRPRRQPLHVDDMVKPGFRDPRRGTGNRDRAMCDRTRLAASGWAASRRVGRVLRLLRARLGQSSLEFQGSGWPPRGDRRCPPRPESATTDPASGRAFDAVDCWSGRSVPSSDGEPSP